MFFVAILSSPSQSREFAGQIFAIQKLRNQKFAVPKFARAFAMLYIPMFAATSDHPFAKIFDQQFIQTSAKKFARRFALIAG
jgi:hypothetical protein